MSTGSRVDKPESRVPLLGPGILDLLATAVAGVNQSGQAKLFNCLLVVRATLTLEGQFPVPVQAVCNQGAKDALDCVAGLSWGVNVLNSDQPASILLAGAQEAGQGGNQRSKV